VSSTPKAEKDPSPGRRAGQQDSVEARYASRRREVTEAAVHLFARQGYEATSFREIADAVGLLKGSLYYYAPSKEQLLYSIISEVLEDSGDLIQRHSTSEDGTVEQLRGTIGDAVKYVIENQDRTIIAMRDFRSLSEESQEKLSSRRVMLWNRLRELIRIGKQEGSIRANADGYVVASAIVGAINYLPSWYELGTPPSSSKMIEGYRDLLIEGLST
jgi:AcrR family transcriptional regulator